MYIPEYINGTDTFPGIKGVCTSVMSQAIPEGTLVVVEPYVGRIGNLIQRKKSEKGAWFAVSAGPAVRFSSLANDVQLSLICLISDGDRGYDRVYQILDGLYSLKYPHTSNPVLSTDEEYSLQYDVLAFRIDWSALFQPDRRPFPDTPGEPATKFAFGITEVETGSSRFRKAINRWWDRDDNSGVIR